MVEGSVGVLRRTDGDNWEVQVINGVGGDRGGNGGLLPFVVRLANQKSSGDESKTHKNKPQNIGCPRLMIRLTKNQFNLKISTFSVEIYANPCMVDVCRNSLKISIAASR